MRNLLAALFASLALSGVARAQTTFETPALPPAPVTAVMATVSSTSTTRGVDVSSAPASSVILDTTQSYRQVCVQNFDTSAFLACGENVNVSTLTTSNLVGVIIPAAPAAASPAAPTCFSVKAGTNYYCRTSSVSGTTRAGITRGR